MKGDEYRQPFLVAVGRPRRPEQLFFVLDQLVVPAGESVLESVGKLFNCHFVFGVDYSPVIKNFREFVASAIHILPAKETGKCACTCTLYLKD